MNYKGEYLNPLVIFAFKKMFATEASKDVLISFLNSVFKGHRHVADLVYVDDKHQGKGLSNGELLLDLLCTDDEGKSFDVELQVGRHQDFEERAIFHAFRLMQKQRFEKPKDIAASEPLRDVYVIALLEDCIEGMPSDKYKHHVCICGTSEGEADDEQLNIVFIELPKFMKTCGELETELDQWVYVFKNMGNIDALPVSMQQKVFETLFSIAERSKLSDEESIAYDSSLKYKLAHDLVVELELKRKQRKSRRAEFLVFRCTPVNGMAKGRAGETHEYVIGPLRKMRRH